MSVWTWDSIIMKTRSFNCYIQPTSIPFNDEKTKKSFRHTIDWSGCIDCIHSLCPDKKKPIVKPYPENTATIVTYLEGEFCKKTCYEETTDTIATLLVIVSKKQSPHTGGVLRVWDKNGIEEYFPADADRDIILMIQPNIYYDISLVTSGRLVIIQSSWTVFTDPLLTKSIKIVSQYLESMPFDKTYIQPWINTFHESFDELCITDNLQSLSDHTNKMTALVKQVASILTLGIQQEYFTHPLRRNTVGVFLLTHYYVHDFIEWMYEGDYNAYMYYSKYYKVIVKNINMEQIVYDDQTKMAHVHIWYNHSQFEYILFNPDTIVACVNTTEYDHYEEQTVRNCNATALILIPKD